jgi:hypothetical protein
MATKTNNGKYWRAEHFVASLLALTSFGAYNSRYTAKFRSAQIIFFGNGFVYPMSLGDIFQYFKVID